MKVVQLKAAKAAIERRRYGAKVLDAFDKIEHADKRGKVEKRAEVERKARNQL